MRMKFSVAAVVALLAVASASAQSDFVNGEALSAVDYTKFWQIALPLRPGQRLTRDAYVVDDQIYVSTNEGFVYAIHADTGAVRWEREVTRRGFRLRQPCHIGKDVVFATPTTVLKLDRIYGEPTGISDFGFACATGVATDGSRLYVGSFNHRFYAYDVASLYEIWKATTAAPVESTPVIHGPRLFVASGDQSVSAMTARNKKLRWQSVVSGPVTADLVVDDNGVYAASRDNSLYLFDFLFGEVRWRARLSGPLDEPPVLTKDLALQYCAADGIAAIEIAIEKDDKRVRWKHANGRTALTTDARNAFIASNGALLDVVSLTDGTFLRSIPTDGFEIGIPSPKNAAIILASPDGRIFCARPKGTPLPTADQVKEAFLPGSTATAAAPTATSKPTAETEEESPLDSSALGPAAGGKSKVSRQFGGAASRPAAKPDEKSRKSDSKDKTTREKTGKKDEKSKKGDEKKDEGKKDEGKKDDGE